MEKGMNALQRSYKIYKLQLYLNFVSAQIKTKNT